MYVSRAGQDQTAKTLIAVLQRAAAMVNVHLNLHIPLHDACAIMDGVAVSANVWLCMTSCGNAPTTAAGMGSALMANVSAMLALMELIAQERSVLILPRPGLGVIFHGATMIVLARACA